MNTFYRYHRPLEYDADNCRMVTPTRGGICLRVEILNNDESYKQVKVSYSICPMTEEFNKDVARKIADTRFDAGHTYLLDVHSVRGEVVAVAMSNYAAFALESPTTILETYKRADLELYLFTHKDIRETHRRTWEMEALTHETIKALNIESRYANSAR